MSLNIYFGPMYAGKTSKLINMYRHTYESKIIIDYNILDLSKNYNPMYVYYGNLKSHDENNIFTDKVLKTKSLNMLNDIDNYNIVDNEKNDLYNKYMNAKFIFINECQFFIDLKYFVLEKLKQDKVICLYGLDADYKQEKFGMVWDLIPYATNVEKINGKCKYCNNPSIISCRITNNDCQYLPDASQYVPLCLNCKNNKLNVIVEEESENSFYEEQE